MPMPTRTTPARKAGMSPSMALTRAGSANTATMIPMRMSQKRLNACSEVRQYASWVLSQCYLPVAGHDPRAYRNPLYPSYVTLLSRRGRKSRRAGLTRSDNAHRQKAADRIIASRIVSLTSRCKTSCRSIGSRRERKPGSHAADSGSYLQSAHQMYSTRTTSPQTVTPTTPSITRLTTARAA